jgi:hypothetical protein
MRGTQTKEPPFDGLFALCVACALGVASGLLARGLGISGGLLAGELVVEGLFAGELCGARGLCVAIPSGLLARGLGVAFGLVAGECGTQSRPQALPARNSTSSSKPFTQTGQRPLPTPNVTRHSASSSAKRKDNHQGDCASLRSLRHRPE